LTGFAAKKDYKTCFRNQLPFERQLAQAKAWLSEQALPVTLFTEVICNPLANVTFLTAGFRISWQPVIARENFVGGTGFRPTAQR
jgi:hypothetical protein